MRADRLARLRAPCIVTLNRMSGSLPSCHRQQVHLRLKHQHTFQTTTQNNSSRLGTHAAQLSMSLPGRVQDNTSSLNGKHRFTCKVSSHQLLFFSCSSCYICTPTCELRNALYPLARNKTGQAAWRVEVLLQTSN